MSNSWNAFLKSIFTRIISAYKKVNRLVFTAISIGIAIVVLGLLLYRQKDVILTYHWQFKPLAIVLAFITYSLALFWVSILWGWIINNLGTRISYRKHIRSYIISNIAKRIPGTIWYVASRLQLYDSDGLDAKVTAVASGMEMVLITLAGILVAIVFSTQTIVQYHISPYILILVFVIGVILLNPRVIKWILTRNNVDLSTIDYKFIAKGILGYVVSWISGGIILYEVGNLIYPIPISNLPYLINCWTLVGIVSMLFFFSPSNLGVTEVGLSLLLSTIVPSSIAVIIALASRILLLLFDIIWAGIFLWIKLPERHPLTQKD